MKKGPAPTADLVRLFKAMASRPRLTILSRLGGGSLCVGALARALGLSQPAVSQHLEVLREAGLVAAERMGVMVHYRLDARRIAAVQAFAARLLAQPPKGCGRRPER
jgi:DNA-binding transcriptional ArsR family regulator